MSGIAGWVDYARDLRQAGSVVRAMTGTLACRGPDAEDVWLAEHVGLGHRRLAVLDPSGGRQPMTVEVEGRAVATVSASGMIENYRELRSELGNRGHRFATESDTEVLARAYAEWGEECVTRLEGTYGFAVWDHAREQLVLVRDRIGIKPLYYSQVEQGIVFGSEPKAVLAHPLIEPVVDADGIRDLLAFVHTPGQAMYRGMYQVPPGCLLRFSRDGMRLNRYWQLEAYEHTDDLDTTVATVRGLLDESIDRQLIADVPVATLLSGGLDSSAITALVARKLAAAGDGPVRSFAVDFAGYTENFTADAMRDTPDAPFVRELAEYVGAEHHDVVLSSAELVDPVHRGAVVRASDLPVGGDMFTSLYLLAAAMRPEATVALCGESADEIFGGYQWFHDEAAWADTFPWLASVRRHAGQAAGSGPALFADDVMSRLDLATYQADSYRAALDEVPHTGTTDRTERRMRELLYLHLTRFGPFLFDRQDRMAMANGVDMRLPICGPRMVQYVFNTPWSYKTFDGKEKSLLRAATKDVLPASIVERKKSPYPATQDPDYERGLRTQLATLVAEDSSPVLDLLDKDRLRALAAGEVSTVSLDRARRGSEVVLALHQWLTHTGARLDLAT